ncbi:MAG: glycerophosphodiester phosphodiesterase family protein, partial [Candidatus Micrarchaeota archaeon]
MLIVAHRGASAYAPENTLTAFRLAEAMNANAIELDVRVSKDGVPVVIHDAFLNRLTNGKGRVKNKTLAELKKLKVKEFEKIPTLKETLEKTALPLFVEIKEVEDTEKVLEVCKNYKKRVVIISFHPEVIIKAKKHGFTTALGAISEFQLVKRAVKLGATYVACFKIFIGKDLASSCKKHKITLLPWVVNDKLTCLRFKAMG